MPNNMMSVQIVKNFDGVDHYLSPRFLHDTGNVTQEFTNDIVTDIRASWSSISPSSPGMPPAVVTGALDQSIKVKEGRDISGRFATSENAISYAIVVESEYGAALEYGDPGKNLAPRPFLRSAIFRAKNKMGDKFKSIFRWRGG
jgi:hypothetical protein